MQLELGVVQQLSLLPRLEEKHQVPNLNTSIKQKIIIKYIPELQNGRGSLHHHGDGDSASRARVCILHWIRGLILPDT